MRAFVMCVLIATLAGCTTPTTGTANKKAIVGDYVFSQDSRYAGKLLRVLSEGDDLFIVFEGRRERLKPEGNRFRFTTGDKVWNKERTAKVLEWFLIAYDPNRRQYYMGSPEDPQWRQYLNNK